MKILLVDDNKITAIGLKKIVSTHSPSTTIYSVENGKKALDFLFEIENKSDLPDLILLDINMPVMSGIEMLEIKKQNDILFKIPIVIHTTSSDKNDFLKCQELGINGYFIKNIDYKIYKKNIILIIDYWLKSLKYNI